MKIPLCLSLWVLLLLPATRQVSASEDRPRSPRRDFSAMLPPPPRAPRPGPSPDTPTEDRDSRFFLMGISNLFSRFVKVKNVACKSATGEEGVCHKKTECSRLQGTANGSCEKGYGTCCTFIQSCGSTTSQNCTYFVNEGFPNSFDKFGSCQLVVNKMNPNICQLRLDFQEFNIAGPEDSTVCTNDRFTVSNGSPVPTICGINSGNHMYITLGGGITTSTILSFITMGPSFNRKWKIKVSQIPCNEDYTAPDNCLQYYTGITGQIKTYNYDIPNGRQLANQDYTSCIKTERSFCGIQYTPCEDPVNADNPESFSLSGANIDGSLKGTANCADDWVIVPCAVGSPSGSTEPCEDRYCGRLLNFDSPSVATAGNAPLFSSVKPFHVIYRTDSTEDISEINNRGYCLDYVQQPCT